MCVLEHYLTIEERATGHAIRTVLLAFCLFSAPIADPHATLTTVNTSAISHSQPRHFTYGLLQFPSFWSDAQIPP